jgi:hypothetical protein
VTCANPDLFKNIEIGEPGMREPFIDGGFSCTNPIIYLLEEAKLMFPD